MTITDDKELEEAKKVLVGIYNTDTTKMSNLEKDYLYKLQESILASMKEYENSSEKLKEIEAQYLNKCFMEFKTTERRILKVSKVDFSKFSGNSAIYLFCDRISVSANRFVRDIDHLIAYSDMSRYIRDKILVEVDESKWNKYIDCCNKFKELL